jgi:hypothetical protein
MQTSQRCVICAAAIGMVGYGAYHALSLIRRVDDSERKLHALICVADVMEAYLKAHDHAWPRSWSDLRETGEVHSGSMYRWPDAADAVQQRVDIDFSVTRDDLANPAFDVTRVIRPRGEYIYDPATRLATLQQFIQDGRPPQVGPERTVLPVSP